MRGETLSINLDNYLIKQITGTYKSKKTVFDQITVLFTFSFLMTLTETARKLHEQEQTHTSSTSKIPSHPPMATASPESRYLL